MAYQKGVPASHVLEEQAGLYKDTSINAIKRRYRFDLGRFFEGANRRGDYVPIAHGRDFQRWVIDHERRGDINPMLYPGRWPIANYWTFVHEEIAKPEGPGIVPVEFVPDGIVEPKLTPIEQRIHTMGYKAFEVYGTEDAARHFIKSTQVQRAARASPSVFRSSNIRGGSIASMDDLCRDLERRLGL